MANTTFHMDMCSMNPGHGKLIVEPDKVLNVNVHRAFHAATATSNTTIYLARLCLLSPHVHAG